MRTEIAACGVSLFVLVGCFERYQLGVESTDGGSSAAGFSGETTESSGGVAAGGESRNQENRVKTARVKRQEKTEARSQDLRIRTRNRVKKS